MIPLVSTLLFYVCADATLGDELHGLVAISVIVYLTSFFVATMFTEVSGMYGITSFPFGGIRTWDGVTQDKIR